MYASNKTNQNVPQQILQTLSRQNSYTKLLRSLHN